MTAKPLCARLGRSLVATAFLALLAGCANPAGSFQVQASPTGGGNNKTFNLPASYPCEGGRVFVDADGAVCIRYDPPTTDHPGPHEISVVVDASTGTNTPGSTRTRHRVRGKIKVYAQADHNHLKTIHNTDDDVLDPPGE